MDYKSVSCSRPRLLFNRGRIYDILERGYYRAGVHHMFEFGIEEDEILSFFSPFKLGLCAYKDPLRKDKGFNIDWKKLELLDYHTYDCVGHKQPLFFVSECGKCEYCRHKKMLLKAGRMQDEALCHDKMPLFVTLTYDNVHLPSDGADKDGVQRFLKRLRHSLGRFRYVLCSEYGKKHGRIHYHLVLYGVDYDEMVPNRWYPVISAIRSAWMTDGRSSPVPLGHVDVRPIRDFNGFVYVSKYISKKNVVPNGKNCNFVLQSRRPGLGAGLITEQMKKFLLTNRCSHADFVLSDPHTGSCRSFVLQRYYLRKLLPSFGDYLPVHVRRAVSCVVGWFSSNSALRSGENSEGIRKSFNTFSDLISIPKLKKVFNPQPLYSDDADMLLRCYKTIASWYDSSKLDYSLIAMARNFYIDTLERKSVKEDFSINRYHILQSVALQDSKIIL